LSQHNNELVSIVDDDPLVRAATSSLVRSLGWDARVFASGAELLASDTLERTRCLVCDVQMPDIDGIELLETLQRKGMRIPTIFITAFATQRMRERVQAGAALCMLDKPIDARELEMWIGRALGTG